MLYILIGSVFYHGAIIPKPYMMETENSTTNNIPDTKTNAFSVVLAFVSTGFLTGFLMGLTGSPVVNSFLAALFTIAGSIAIIFFTKMDRGQINLVLKVLSSLSISCFIGLLIGIRAKAYEWFIPKERQVYHVAMENRKVQDSLFSIYLQRNLLNEKQTNPLRENDSLSISNRKAEITRLYKLVADQLNKSAILNTQPVAPLKGSTLNGINYIDKMRREKLYTKEMAYDSLYKYILDELSKKH